MGMGKGEPIWSWCYDEKGTVTLGCLLESLIWTLVTTLKATFVHTINYNTEYDETYPHAQPCTKQNRRRPRWNGCRVTLHEQMFWVTHRERHRERESHDVNLPPFLRYSLAPPPPLGASQPDTTRESYYFVEVRRNDCLHTTHWIFLSGSRLHEKNKTGWMLLFCCTFVRQ